VVDPVESPVDDGSVEAVDVAVESPPVVVVADAVTSLSPPLFRVARHRPTTTTTAMMARLRIRRKRCLRSWVTLAWSRRAWRPAFCRSRLAVPTGGRR
jgi:hypothetical protein